MPLWFALTMPETREAHCGAEFPGLGLLLPCYGQRSLEIRMCFLGIGLRRLERNFAS
jgi:hypothetical protein